MLTSGFYGYNIYNIEVVKIIAQFIVKTVIIFSAIRTASRFLLTVVQINVKKKK